MMVPSIAPADPEFNVGVLDAACARVKQILETEHEVLVIPGSGRAAIDATIVSLIEPGEAVVVIRAGLFGDMVRDATERVGGNAVVLDVEWGRGVDLRALEAAIAQSKAKAVSLVHNETSTGTLYPLGDIGAIARKHGCLYLVDTVSSLGGIRIANDAAGCDVNMSAPQKCLAGPMGCGIVSVSRRAFEAMERRKRKAPSFTLDLLRWKQVWIPRERGGDVTTGARRQPVGMPIHLVYALAEATKVVLEEGLEARFRRHRIAGEALRGAARAMGLEILGDEAMASPTVTCVKLPAGMTSDQLVKAVRAHSSIGISAGLDKLRETTVRVGHMGITAAPSFLLPTIAAMEAGLRSLGFPAPRGKALEAAEAVFAGQG
jgi:aspartate aminotransferase-like enzyme